MYVCLHNILATRYANTFGTGTESLNALFHGPGLNNQKRVTRRSGDYIIERICICSSSLSSSFKCFSSLTRMDL